MQLSTVVPGVPGIAGKKTVLALAPTAENKNAHEIASPQEGLFIEPPNNLKCQQGGKVCQEISAHVKILSW